MLYVLLNDDCEICQYVSNAFTLLGLPLNLIPNSELNSKKISQANFVFSCKRVDINASDASFIFITNSNAPFTGTKKPVYFLPFPFSKNELKNILAHCDNKHYVPDFTDIQCPEFKKLVGTSAPISKVKTMIKQVANSDATILILGASGTGKDVVASSIHQLSNRKDKPFIPINCGAIPSELMESELFGHEKGSFTGAATRRIGRFELANGGTLFLDEIGDMPLSMQVKLLRVLQDRKIERVGGNTSIEVNVRLIAATNKNLEELIQKGAFREDLFYRLNVFPISMPSLKDRPEDIPFLIDYHLDLMQERLKHKVAFAKEAKDILCHYAWPGNIRELQNFLERMVILYPDCVLQKKDIELGFKQKTLPLDEHIQELEKELIKTVLDKTHGALTETAKELSLNKNSLRKKMKKYSLNNETV